MYHKVVWWPGSVWTSHGLGLALVRMQLNFYDEIFFAYFASACVTASMISRQLVKMWPMPDDIFLPTK